MRWLVTGFEPFNGEAINPSQLLAQQCASRWDSEVLILPVSYKRSVTQLESALKKIRPDFVLSLGQAAGRSQISLERVALNFADSALFDADGVTLIEQKILSHCDSAYFSQLPLRQILMDLKARGQADVHVSTSAGTYVCNHLYYHLLMWKAQNLEFSAKSLFVHVPYLHEQVREKAIGTPAMSLTQMLGCVEALRELILQV